MSGLHERAAAYVEADQVESLVASARARLAALCATSGKTCAVCGVVKPLSEFTTLSSQPDGLEYRCRSCKNGRVRDRRT